MKNVEVVAAIIKKNDAFLALQRNENKHPYISFKYEFPGGKVEVGEDLKEALRREIIEEMALDLPLDAMTYFMTVEHTYPHFHIKMHSYLCEVESVAFELKEHIDARWLTDETLFSVDWAEADVPIVKALVK